MATAANQVTDSAVGVEAGFNIPDPNEIERLEGKVSDVE